MATNLTAGATLVPTTTLTPSWGAARPGDFGAVYTTPVPEGMPTTSTFLAGTPTPVVLTRANSTSTTLAAPAPAPLVGQPENVINILLLGSDQKEIGSVGRTDTIIIATIHPRIPAVSLLSIPRDFYAWMPGRGFYKINTAFSRGGPALMKATIRHNFGVEVDYYARIGFDSFVKIVDALGGVTVEVERPLHDPPSGQSGVQLEPGTHHRDGEQALWYVSSRRTTSDFDRQRRQQEVLRALCRRALRSGVIGRIRSLWGGWRESVSTDLDLRAMIRLGAIGMRLDPANVKSRFVGLGAVEPWTDPRGLYVLVPDVETLRSVVSEALAPPRVRP
ncbi:MAG: LCP family protein [Chloroflexota bacterium]